MRSTCSARCSGRCSSRSRADRTGRRDVGAANSGRSAIAAAAPATDTNRGAETLLDAVKGYVITHRLDLTDGRGSVMLANGEEFTLGHVDADEKKGIRAHIELWNERRAFSFESIDELRGWLRRHRSEHGAASRLERENLRDVVRQLRTAFVPADLERAPDGSLSIAVDGDALDALGRLTALTGVE